MSPNITVPKVIEHIEHPWGHQNATANGVGYDATPNNVSADGTWRAVGHKVFNAWPFGYAGGAGTLRMVEVGVTVAFISPDNGDNTITWKLQGRNNSPNEVNAYTWVDLSETLTQTRPINTAWKDNSLSGRIPLQTNFDSVPFELQAVFQGNTAAVIRARMKNSGYVDYQYTMD